MSTDRLNADFEVNFEPEAPPPWEGMDQNECELPPGAFHALPPSEFGEAGRSGDGDGVYEVTDLPPSEFGFDIEGNDLPAVSTKHPTNQWDPRLVLDLAIGVDGLQEILTRYGLSTDEFDVLSRTPVFRRELALAIKDAHENGLPFAHKARVQAESYLEVLDQLVYSEAVPASTRLEAIRSTVKWGRLEPDTKGDNAQTNAQQINININF